jgi:hypothetical protein
MAAIGLTVAANVAIARSGPHFVGGLDSGYSASQQKLMTDPCYSVDTGSAPVGKSDPNRAVRKHRIQAKPKHSISTGSTGGMDLR